MDSCHTGPVTEKIPFDDVIMFAREITTSVGITTGIKGCAKWQVFFRRDVQRIHDDVIKRKHFPRYWPFVWGIHRSPVNSPHKGLWRGTFMFSLISVWTNGWVNNRDAGDLRRYRDRFDVTVMYLWIFFFILIHISLEFVLKVAIESIVFWVFFFFFFFFFWGGGGGG